MNPLGSHKDRHARLGEGRLASVLKSHYQSSRLTPSSLLFGTPNDLDGYAREIAMMREAWS